MASEQLSLGVTMGPVDGQIDAATNFVEPRPVTVDCGDDVSKVPRLPRWTRQEILVLIQGKRVAENQVRRGRVAGLAFGTGQVEPKWASVSSYCKLHGVNRGPVQCRKRWSNLAGDFKKIKEWETNIRDESESFWVMRNDLRRERKLPGFFDKEVYDILGGVATATEIPSSAIAPALSLALALNPTPTAQDVEEDAETFFDSGRSAAADDGLFSDFEQDEGDGSPQKMEPAVSVDTGKAVPARIPVSGTTKEKHPASNPELGSSSHETRKRKRVASDGDEETGSSAENHLIDVLEKNGKLLVAQLEAQNINFHQDREQRKDHGDNLVAVLNKLADALGRIADKL